MIEMEAISLPRVHEFAKRPLDTISGDAHGMALSLGDLEPLYQRALVHKDGRGVPVDHLEAVRLFQLAAEQGHAGAQFEVGNNYSWGLGVEENDVEAIRWYRMAAEQGHAEAQYRLVYFYGNGEGVEKNVAEAMRWCRMAAKQGHVQAQYIQGIGDYYD
jgi:TPR repeat protein